MLAEDGEEGSDKGEADEEAAQREEVKAKSRSKTVSQDDLRRDNKRLKDAISKELRKPGKSKSNFLRIKQKW